MPLEIKDCDNGLGNIIECRGIVREKEFVAAMKAHLQQSENKFRQYRYSLTDYTHTRQLDISTDSIEQIADFCCRAAKVNPDAIVALVAQNDFFYGLSRMWEMMSYETGWDKMVFRSSAEAKSWIRERMMAKFGIAEVSFT